MFKALMLEKDESGFRASVRPVDEAGLPEGDVLVAVDASTPSESSQSGNASRGRITGIRSCTLAIRRLAVVVTMHAVSISPPVGSLQVS